MKNLLSAYTKNNSINITEAFNALEKTNMSPQQMRQELIQQKILCEKFIFMKIAIKVGTRAIIAADGAVRKKTLQSLVEQIAILQKAGHQLTRCATFLFLLKI